MHEQELKEFRQTLLRRGIAPTVAERVARELEDHFGDLVDELRSAGIAEDEALRKASAAMGRLDDVAAAMCERRELKAWPYRYPYVALLFYPLACLVALPAVPVMASAAYASQLVRWAMSLVAAGVLTAALLLLLQLSILFG